MIYTFSVALAGLVFLASLVVFLRVRSNGPFHPDDMAVAGCCLTVTAGVNLISLAWLLAALWDAT